MVAHVAIVHHGTTYVVPTTGPKVERCCDADKRVGMSCRVLRQPAPVPPGLESTFTVELVGERIGDFVGEVTVKTEVNVFTLTVSAKIVPGAADQAVGQPDAVQGAVDHN